MAIESNRTGAGGLETRPVTRKPGAGRRRDPAIDGRLRQAARILYAREGWAGFHFDGVAKAAGVSKDAVYRRYPDAETLLLDALSDDSVPMLAEDMPVKEALVSFAREVFVYFASGNGHANLRVHVDGALYPNVLQQYRSRVVEPQLSQAVGVLERGRQSGELHPDADPTVIMEALGGAVMVHALATAHLGEDAAPNPETMRVLEGFVHQLLYGHVARP
ncbi:TetR/AcrR family transcriptional regulator [Mycobacterium sp. CVI_P3]|uniref:TetR/AcrR family transcriptional regulator n=1 Tax=Mycobacterium pinniadriaticum TaxID=2994102 RepID=A0ABT3SC23_9MYCO|nr:TetR/AcrR family transcriptional regulator [Mycobacterium pinniadriaticum]MCX2930619.1 TetR/AcrR family transcriptional regulator [Mycobacterium pinniadriaticum]MCX2937043.1 TetR/AcrR family transcriptional regulator [Mycobacterium pinniadriaticum]